MRYDYPPAYFESEYTTKTGLTSNVLKATKAEQEDKVFVIQNVSRPAYVTEITHLSKNMLSPCFALDEWDWESKPFYDLPHREYELQYVAKQFKDDRDVVLAAMLYDKQALYHASKRLQDDWLLNLLMYIPISRSPDVPALLSFMSASVAFIAALLMECSAAASLGLALLTFTASFVCCAASLYLLALVSFSSRDIASIFLFGDQKQEDDTEEPSMNFAL
jgi:hypothetical protein